jgi:polysaccharide biosynthesis transport protein
MPPPNAKEARMNSKDGAFEHALRVLRRRKFAILAAIVSVPLAAFLFSMTQEERYTSTATLLFESTTVTTDPSREVATNEELAGLPVIAVRTAKELGGGYSSSEVLGSIEISSSNEMANIAEISATADTPARSAQIANTYAETYISFRREAEQSQVQQAIDLVEQSLEDLSAEESVGVQGQSLRERLNELEVKEALQTGRTELVQRAEEPTSPSSPKTKRNVALGFLVGLILAFALAAGLERIDRRVRSPEELEALFDLPLIARIPRSRAIAESTPADLLQLPEAEVFRILRMNLQYLSVNRKLRAILIASPEPNDGKSTVARCLATMMAAMGDDVVLVEADLRKESSFARITRLPEHGLSSVLAGTARLDDALTRVSVAGADRSRSLTVLPSGPIPPNPSELLERDRMKALIGELNMRFEIVVIDTPAVGIVSDALAVVPNASQVVAVGGVGRTTREGAAEFMKQLTLLDRKPVGLVATMTEPEKNQYAYYRRPGIAASD